MASLSMITWPGWNNGLLQWQAPLAPLPRRGAGWPGVWASSCCAGRVQAPGPVYCRFLLRPRLLTRLSPLPAHRATTLFPSVSRVADCLGATQALPSTCSLPQSHGGTGRDVDVR
jgi:hypothetical protein